jgi:hypothetical protein
MEDSLLQIDLSYEFKNSAFQWLSNKPKVSTFFDVSRPEGAQSVEFKKCC